MIRINKYAAISCIVLMIVAASAYKVCAHPPVSMILEYDFEEGLLSVDLTHITPGPSIHYINKVEIFVNGELLLTEEYTSQPDQNAFTYVYTVDAASGDDIGVTAYCNIQGLIQREITVIDPEADNPPEIQIVNPVAGYLHFYGVRLFPLPQFASITTVAIGGFRLDPVTILAVDDIDPRRSLTVKAYAGDSEIGTASFNNQTGYHELDWNSSGRAAVVLSVTAEDSGGNIGTYEIELSYVNIVGQDG